MKIVKNMTAFILLGVYIWMQFYAPINIVALVLKNISLFLIIGIGAYAVTTAITKNLLEKYNPKGIKETLLYIGRILSFGLIMLLFSTFQYNYIQFNEVPVTMGCKYYDDYNNLIYKSKFYGVCPELEIESKEDNKLVFNVREETILPDQTIEFNEQDFENATLEIKMVSTISIKYYEDTKIKSVNFQVTYNNYISNQESSASSYYSLQQQIINNYTDGFESMVSEAKEYKLYDHIISENLNHAEFDSLDYSQIRYYTKPSDGIYQYNLEKEYLNENKEITTENIASINYSSDNKTYTVKPFDLPDYIGERLIHVEINDQDITWRVNSKTQETVYNNQYVFNNKLVSEKDIKASSNEKLYYEDKFMYHKISQRNNLYLYVEETTAKSLTGEYANQLYAITNEPYGKKVEYLLYREQHYINSLLYGELNSDKLYFDSSDYVEGLRDFHEIFNIEYHLENLETTDHVLYHIPSYFIFD